MAILGSAQYYLSRAERIRLVDQQIEGMASTLYSSELTKHGIQNMEKASSLVAGLLGDEKLSAVITIFDSAGNPLYKNPNAEQLDTHLSQKMGKELVQTQGHVLRLLTVPLEDGKRSLQVGLILDRNLLRWRSISLRLIAYGVFTLIFVITISYFLSYLLLRPIERLASYLQHRATSLELSPLPQTSSPPLFRLKHRKLWNEDEVWKLTKAIDQLLAKVRTAAQINQSRAAILAHELKTPLTIIKNMLESDPTGSRVKPALLEIDRLASLVNGFTQWSLFENQPGMSAAIHAVKLHVLLNEIVEKLEPLYPNRLTLNIDSDCTVFSNREDTEHAITNLVINALRYSPANEKVHLKLKGPTLTIQDRGPGISQRVIKNLGAPFNVGENTEEMKGTGLGLAWVFAIARRYGWSFDLKTWEKGTEAVLSLRSAH